MRGPNHGASRSTSIMGIDPGLTRCGIGVVTFSGGSRIQLAHVSVAQTPVAADLSARLLSLEHQLSAAMDTYDPQRVVVERVFSQHNVRTVIGTAQAAAVAVLLAGRRGIPVSLRTPTEAKAAVTGNGRADKAQVTAMVMRILNVRDPIRPADAADALALAITEAWRGAAQDRIAAAARTMASRGAS